MQTLGPVALSPVLASGAGKPSEQILCRLLWLEAVGDAAMGGGPLNKIQARADSCSCKIQALLHLLAVGRGGEEKVVVVGMLCSYWSRLAHCPAGGLRIPRFLLAGRGGVGEDCGGGMMLGGWW
jgi:hypothetical protein